MPFVLVAVKQQIPVQLADMVFRQADMIEGFENPLHCFRVPGNFLLITRDKGASGEICQELLHVAVRQGAALDARGRAHAFDGRYPSQGGQPLRRNRPQSLPRAFELVDLGCQGEHFRGDEKAFRRDHVRKHIRFHPFYQSIFSSDSIRFV